MNMPFLYIVKDLNLQLQGQLDAIEAFYVLCSLFCMPPPCGQGQRLLKTETKLASPMISLSEASALRVKMKLQPPIGSLL